MKPNYKLEEISDPIARAIYNLFIDEEEQ